MVLRTLLANNVLLKWKKCEFHKQTTTYLGLIISPNGISMDPAKVQAVEEWNTPQNMKDVLVFLGFTNFYRRFILDFTAVAKPLTQLRRKDHIFTWSSEAQMVFDTRKQAIINAPILMHFDNDNAIVVETEASDYVSAVIMS